MTNFVFYNKNPKNNFGNDCVIRAISFLLNTSWYSVYDDITALGREMCDMPSSNIVWGKYLESKGYTRQFLYSDQHNWCDVNMFCHSHPHGRYLLCLKEHVTPVIEGHYYDTAEIGDEKVIAFWYKGDDR